MSTIIKMPGTADETLRLKNNILTVSGELNAFKRAYDEQPPETARKFYKGRWNMVDAKQDEYNGYYIELSERIKNLKECKQLIAKNNEVLKEIKRKLNNGELDINLEGVTKKHILDNPDIYNGEIYKKQNSALRFVLGVESPPSPTKTKSKSPPKTRSRSPSKGGKPKRKCTRKRH